MTNEKQTPKIKYLFSHPLTIIFATFVYIIFALYIIFPDTNLSEWENRYLQQRPKITISDLKDGKYMRDYEDYTNDQLPFRNFFIKVKAVSETVMLKLENNGIAKGGQSYLFTKEIKGTETFDKNISIIEKFAGTISQPVKLAAAPNACGVLEDNMPTGFPVANQSEKLQRLSLLNDVFVVDLYSAELAHGDEYIYYRTDHHWTSLGAYYAYLAISDADSPISLEKLTEHSVDGFYGTLYAKYKGIGVKPDTLKYYDIPVKEYIADNEAWQDIYDLDKLDEFDKYGMFMRGNFGFSTIKSGVCTNGKSLIVFKDSYANCLIPYLLYDYENISVIDLRYYKGNIREFIDSEKDAEILFLYNFDFLNEDNHFYKLMQ